MIGGLMKTTSYLAMAAAASLIIGGVTLAPKAARAADLGGDCCADLESRVAELEATTVRKGNKKISVTLSGRVNANMLFWNDGAGFDTNTKPFGDSTDVYFGNNHGGSESNFNLSGSGKLSADWTAGFYMEIRNDFGVSATADQLTDQHGPQLSPQNMYVYLSSKRVGEIRLGRSGSASGDGYYVDYGASTLGGLSGGRNNGDFFLRDNTGALTTTTYGGITVESTDTGGVNRIWYATPNLGGIVGKIALGGDSETDASLTYHGKHGSVNLAAGVAWDDFRELEGDYTNVGVSASIYEESSGLFFTGAWGQQDDHKAATSNPNYWFIHGGWQKNVTGAGLTTVDAQYHRSNNGIGNDINSHNFGVGIDQALDSVASNIYLRYQRHTLDTDVTGLKLQGGAPAAVTNTQSIDSVIMGMIVRF